MHLWPAARYTHIDCAALKKGGWLEGSSRQRRTRCKHVLLDAHVALSWLMVLLFIFLSGNKLLVSAVVCGVRPLCSTRTIALFVSPFFFLSDVHAEHQVDPWPLSSSYLLYSREIYRTGAFHLKLFMFSWRYCWGMKSCFMLPMRRCKDSHLINLNKHLCFMCDIQSK